MKGMSFSPDMKTNMSNEEYHRVLKDLPLNHKERPSLVTLHEQVFGQKPRSRAKKTAVVQKLYNKFIELNKDNPNADEPITETVNTEPEVKKAGNSKPGSRRGKIIEMVQEGIWDTKSLAEALNAQNPDWPVDKNKAAISGTLADMRKNHGWIAKTNDDGRIEIILPEKS